MSRRSSPAAWPAKLSFGSFLSGLFAAKRRSPDPKAARTAQVRALESLERRELLYGSDGQAWISLSSGPVPDLTDMFAPGASG